MARLAEASGWVCFDVLARNGADAACVAIWLREHLPQATIRSDPAPCDSGDPELPHLLHCRAYITRFTAAQTRAHVETALEHLDLPGARARIAFREPPAGAAETRAA